MPEVRKLTPAEVETLERKPTSQRRQIEEQYDALLSDYAVGEYGEAVLEADEKRLTVRNRFRAAAAREVSASTSSGVAPTCCAFR
jgi:hypothetical protein